MSGKSKTQTQTTTSQPYKSAQPLLNQGMNDALKQYKAGGLVKPNTMSTVVPYAKQSMEGMDVVQDWARKNIGGAGASGVYRDVIGSGGFNQPQKTAVQGWQKTATGDFDLNANPEFQSVLKQATDSASNAVNESVSAMGRYGSGTHQGNLAREIGDLSSRMAYGEYQNWQNRKDAAQGNLFNAGQQGFQNVGTAYEGALAPGDALMGVGSMWEDLAGRQLNDQLRIANEKQNAPLANIQALLAAASGAGSYGQTTQSAQVPGSGFSNAMGGLLGSASLLRGIL